MAAITTEQKKEIRRLTRAANRRLERATPGQRSALEFYVNKSVGANKFSAATKGMTSEEAELQLKILKRFMDPNSISTRKGWDRVKRESVHKANETLSMQGYDLTDEELAEIFRQIGTAKGPEFYRAVNLVSAAKIEAGENWHGTPKEIADAIAQKATYQQALEMALNARAQREQDTL